MLFRIDPDPAEMRRACRAIVAASLPRSRANEIMVAVWALAAGTAFLFTPTTADRTVGIAVGTVLVTVLGLQLEGARRARRLQAQDPHAREPHFVELSAGGLRTWCDHVDARYTWNGTARVVETREFFLFLRGSGSGLAIPKRLLDAARDRELRDRIRESSPDRGQSLAA